MIWTSMQGKYRCLYVQINSTTCKKKGPLPEVQILYFSLLSFFEENAANDLSCWKDLRLVGKLTKDLIELIENIFKPSTQLAQQCHSTSLETAKKTLMNNSVIREIHWLIKTCLALYMDWASAFIALQVDCLEALGQTCTSLVSSHHMRKYIMKLLWQIYQGSVLRRRKIRNKGYILNMLLNLLFCSNDFSSCPWEVCMKLGKKVIRWQFYSPLRLNLN